MRAYRWPDPTPVTGVAFVRTMIRPNHLRDGATKTYLLGEKYISAKEYGNADEGSGGDDQAMYIGDDADIRRWAESPPMPDSRRLGTREVFGSAHTGGCHFVLCDGSVQTVSYDVDMEIHRRLGNRQDGKPVDPTGL
jgi:prepilin-type processing-associated H-X9-DG protein